MNLLKNWRDPMSTLTHLLALVFIIPTMFILLYISYFKGGIFYLVTFSIFAISLILLYSASTVYHMLTVKKNIISILKKIDHMMIFVLIAGTYTPICLITLNGLFGYIMLTIIWIIAIMGIFLKFFWIKAPRWLSTTIYVAMGWFSLFAFYPLKKVIEINGILTLMLGGIIYTIGAIIYSTKCSKLNFKSFGFHEIFHLFVIGGSTCHIIFMFKYVL